MGLLLGVARAKVGFLVDVASADIAVMGRVRDIRRERIGVIDRHGGVKRGTVYMIDERGDDVRPMEVGGSRRLCRCKGPYGVVRRLCYKHYTAI